MIKVHDKDGRPLLINPAAIEAVTTIDTRYYSGGDLVLSEVRNTAIIPIGRTNPEQFYTVKESISDVFMMLEEWRNRNG